MEYSGNNVDCVMLALAKKAGKYLEDFDIGALQETWVEKVKEKDEIKKIKRKF